MSGSKNRSLHQFPDKKELNIMIRLCLSIQDIMKLHDLFIEEGLNKNRKSNKMYIIKITIGHLVEAKKVIDQFIKFSEENPKSVINQIFESLDKKDKENIKYILKIIKSYKNKLDSMRNNLVFHYEDDKNLVKQAIEILERTRETSNFYLEYPNRKSENSAYISIPDKILNTVFNIINITKEGEDIDNLLGEINSAYRKFLDTFVEICLQYFEKSSKRPNYDLHKKSLASPKAGDS